MYVIIVVHFLLQHSGWLVVTPEDVTIRKLDEAVTRLVLF